MNLLFSIEAFSQLTFERTYNFPLIDVYGNSAKILPDGGYIFFNDARDSTGSGSNGYYQFITRTNLFGDTLWQKIISTGANPDYNDFLLLRDSIIVLGGHVNDGVIISMYSISGDSIKSGIVYPNDTSGFGTHPRCSGIYYTHDNCFIISGYRDSSICCNNIKYVIKADSAFNIIWRWEIVSGDYQIGTADIIETSDHNYLIGCRESMGGANSPFATLTKLDSLGNWIWTNAQVRMTHYHNSLQENLNHNIIFCGTWAPPLTGPIPTFKGYIEELDQAGNRIWLDTNVSCFYLSCDITLDGGIIVTGYELSDTANYLDNVILIKYDRNHNMLWKKSFPAYRSCYGQSVFATPDSGFIVGGTSSLFVSSGNRPTSDFYLLKTDKNGNVLSTGINSIESKANFELYPVPVNDWIYIDNLPEQGNNLFVRIIQPDGRIVKSFQLESSSMGFSISELPSGLYFLEMIIEGKKLSRSFIKI